MATIPSQQGQMNTKPSETGSTGTTEGMMGTNHYMSDMKVDQPASSPMANMMKKDDKAMLPNTGEAKTATAWPWYLWSNLGRACWTFGFDNQTRRLRFKSLKH